MSYTMTVEPLGEVIDVEEGQSLLDAALRHGIYLPHACCHGLCGTCKVTVVDGEIDHGDASDFALMDMERDEGRCLACCATPESDIIIEADIEEDPDHRRIPLQDFEAEVVDLSDLTPTIKKVVLSLGSQQLDFQPGQYVNLSWAGLDRPRAFSIANKPDGRGQIELNIRKVPGGVATSYIHDNLSVGDSVTVSGPLGQFFVRKSDSQPVIFFAGGSGLSSPRSMILDLLENDGDSRQITLVYGARNREELYYHDEFVALAAKHPNFSYVPALSEPTDACHWEGASGYVHDVAAAHFEQQFSGHKAYLCGPPIMIESGIKTLMQGRLFERDIYTEKFLSTADADEQRSPLFKRL